MTLQSCITSRAFFPGQGQVVSFVDNDSSCCPHTWMNADHEDSKLMGDWGINKKANIAIMYMESYSIQDIHVCPSGQPKLSDYEYNVKIQTKNRSPFSESGLGAIWTILLIIWLQFIHHHTRKTLVSRRQCIRSGEIGAFQLSRRELEWTVPTLASLCLIFLHPTLTCPSLSPMPGWHILSHSLLQGSWASCWLHVKCFIFCFY